MKNAKAEFLNAIRFDSKVKCAEIHYNPCTLWEETPPESRSLLLKQNYTAEEYTAFLDQLDFEYDNGYGGQELFGTVWLTDGTWLTRGEYDGSEWWDYNSLPEIPAELV